MEAEIGAVCPEAKEREGLLAATRSGGERPGTDSRQNLQKKPTLLTP